MIPSENAYRMIRLFEDLKLTAYKDVAGVWTIGYGTIMYPDGKRVKEGDTIVKTYAEACLKWEVEQKAKSVNAFLKNVVVNQNQFDSCISFSYNEGVGAFEGSTLLKRIKKNPQDPAITDAFMMWVKVTNPKTKKLEVSNGLVRRRKLEAAYYFKPL